MAAHRYWRIGTYANAYGAYPGQYMCIANIEFAETAGGTNRCTGGTPAASSFNDSGHSPAQAFDGSTSTFWNDTQYGSPGWISYDFGSGVAWDITEVRIYPRTDAPYTSPTLITLEYSDNNSTWSRLNTFTPATWVASVQQTFRTTSAAATAAHRYWQIFMSGNGSDIPAIGDLEFRTVAGGSTALTGGTISASSSLNASYLPAQVLDNNAATLWSASAAVDGSWIKYDFGAGVTRDIVEVYLRGRNDGYPQTTPVTFDLQYSDDNTTWTTLFTASGAPWSVGQAKTFPPQPPTVFATRVYLTNTALSTWVVPADFTPSANNIEVIGGGGAWSPGQNNAVIDGAGGGGGYSKAVNVALTIGATIAIKVGAGGVPGASDNTFGTAGGDSWVASNNTATAIGSTGVVAGAHGGAAGAHNGTAAGGSTTGAVGSVIFAGGGSGNGGAAGGGGAAGPYGQGKNGGGASTSGTSGAGGGGSGGGVAGANGGTSTAGGAGGASYGYPSNTAGGAAGAYNTDGGVPASGGGGGGGAGNSPLPGSKHGGAGGNGNEWNSTHGAGGGGGGSGGGASASVSNTSQVANGGLYGGGAGSAFAGSVFGGGYGGQGVIVISYNGTAAGGTGSAATRGLLMA